MVVAQFSLKQTLADISPGLPPGFDPSKGIRSLFPQGSHSIKELANYHFLYSSSLHAVGITCPFTIDIWGGGKYHFFGTANNGDVFDANYAIGFTFGFSPGGVAKGDYAGGTAGAESSDHFDHSGIDDWVRNNWPQAFASGVNTDLKVSENPFGEILQALIGALTFVGIAVFIALGGHVEWTRNNGGWDEMNPPKG
jgi:hypothetical protein